MTSSVFEYKSTKTTKFADPEVDALVAGMADALLEIVGQPWVWQYYGREVGVDGPWCPSCGNWISFGEHRKDCSWLIAARALEIA